MTERRTQGVQPAWLLHRWDWSETSLVLELFTRSLGRVAVVAKGAQRPYSQLRSVLLPFQRLNVVLTRPAGEATELHNLRTAEWAGQSAMIGARALFPAFYLNELLMRLLGRHDAHQALFDAYGVAVTTLAQADGDDALTAAALRAFELVLLHETGVLPQLDCVTHTQQPVRPDGRYTLRPDGGLVAAGADALALSGTDLLQLQAALVASLQAPADIQAAQALCQATGQAASGLRPQLRTLLAYHLGPQPLRTRQALHDVQRLLDVRTTP
ncbi:MAG: DNA repair protein RecO [Aquabacterium sp.]